MKSMLHEASSVIKAIEKAWTESGKPVEFTIKILEKGEKNFLGISKRPAIISITYGSSFSHDRPKSGDFVRSKSFKNLSEVASTQAREQSRDRQHTQKVVAKDELKGRDLQPKNVNKERLDLQTQKNNVPVDKNNQSEKEIHSWDADMIDFCLINLKEILAHLRVEASFTTKVNSGNLVITFDKSITSSVVEDLKSFFASLAHILMQFLKKKFKKKFKSIQIIINYSASNDAHSPNKSN